MEKVFEIYIRTTPERLWDAITNSEIRGKYHFGNRVTSDWTPGGRFELANGDFLLGEGENTEVDPPRRLVQTMRCLWSDEVKEEGTSRVTWRSSPWATIPAGSSSPTTRCGRAPTPRSTAAGP